MEQRIWFYLLPSGETAENMLEGCEKMRTATGHNFSAEAFRSLVRKDVVKKINRYTNCIYSKRDATNDNNGRTTA